MANGFEYDNSYNVHDNLFTLNLKYFLITKLLIYEKIIILSTNSIVFHNHILQ